MNEHELPFLAGIAGMLRWCEELANIISGPLLTAGLAIALIDLLTDGALLTAQPALLYAWAISQAVGVDAQLVASWDRARQALRSRRYWSLLGLLILGVALAYVGYLAAIVFAIQQSSGITTAQALARLGLDSGTWLVSRAVLSVVLVCLSGWTRYHPPARSSLEEESAKLQRELTLEPLRAQVRMRTAIGWRDLGRSIVQGDAPAPSGALPTPTQEAAGVPSEPDPMHEPATVPAPAQTPVEPPDDTPPTPPSAPRSKPRRRNASKRAPVLRLQRPDNAEHRIRAVLGEDPGVSIRQLAKRAAVSTATASKWRKVLLAEGESERAAP